MLGRFLPKETNFFNYFEQHSALLIDVCAELQAMASESPDIEARSARIKQIEREADTITQQCIEALHKTFITPIDRADIHSLIKKLDDIIDGVDSSTSRLVMYEIKVLRPEAVAMAEVLSRAAREVDQAVRYLRDMKNATKIEEKCTAIYKLENEGDTILRMALSRLFKEETDAIQILKWKEIFERLEKTIDRCESVANIIQGIVIEAS